MATFFCPQGGRCREAQLYYLFFINEHLLGKRRKKKLQIYRLPSSF